MNADLKVYTTDGKCVEYSCPDFVTVQNGALYVSPERYSAATVVFPLTSVLRWERS